jgi:hypothetical protein
MDQTDNKNNPNLWKALGIIVLVVVGFYLLLTVILVFPLLIPGIIVLWLLSSALGRWAKR